MGELSRAGQSFVKFRFLARLNANYSPILSQERNVENTLRMIGLTINSDKRLEVLFTSAIMRGFRSVIISLDFEKDHQSN